jgi:hypothetical protein
LAVGQFIRLVVLKGLAMNRKTFLKGLALAGASIPCCSLSLEAETGKCGDGKCMSDAGAVRQFLTDFIIKEETHLDHDTLLKLMKERGRACCRTLDFRQKLITDSQGDLDKLVELMGKLVGAENCTRQGNSIKLVYPVTKCVCTANPVRAASPDDPYCNCSAANNQSLFATVSGKPVTVNVVDSPRRGGQQCVFDIRLG